MRILMLSINFWPEETGIGVFSTYRAAHLQNSGHNVMLCTTFPYYPEWKRREEYRGELFARENYLGIEVVRVPAYIPSKVTSFRRVLHELSFVIASLFACMQAKKFDLVYVMSPPLGLGVVGIVLAKMWKCPLVFDVLDLQPDSAAEHGMLAPWLLQGLYKVEKKIYDCSTQITTITDSMQKKICSKGVPENKVCLTEPKSMIASNDICDEDRLGFRVKYSLGTAKLVIHTGNIGVKQCLDLMVSAASISLGDDNLLYLIVGDGSDRMRLEARTQELGLENLRFLPLLNENEFQTLLAESALCVISQSKDISEVAFPSKLVSYMSAGGAVIAAVPGNGEVAKVINESGGGCITKPEDPVELVRNIKRLIGDGVQPFQEKSREYAMRRWSTERVMGDFERMLTGLDTEVA
jgi:colanic acid biosynthesis glycosyl transferase WcaI